MGSMAPTDCATPALVGGSSLLRWTTVYGRYHRAVQRYLLDFFSWNQAVVGHGDGDSSFSIDVKVSVGMPRLRLT